jgi:branched-chain amino acid transport system permease protein
MDPFLSMLGSILVVILCGFFLYRFLIDPIREHESAVLIATIALAIAIQEAMVLVFTATYVSVPSLVEGYFTIMGAKVFYQQLITVISVMVVLVGLYLLLKKTRLGIAIRCTAQDKEVANLMGINESRVALITTLISLGLAAYAGAVVVPLTTLHPFMWMHPLIMMMAVVVLGGLGSLKGSFLGAYILGLAESLVVFWVPKGSFLKSAVALSIMIAILLIKPEGLFGVKFEEER